MLQAKPTKRNSPSKKLPQACSPEANTTHVLNSLTTTDIPILISHGLLKSPSGAMCTDNRLRKDGIRNIDQVGDIYCGG
jgi:hypothetical protein